MKKLIISIVLFLITAQAVNAALMVGNGPAMICHSGTQPTTSDEIVIGGNMVCRPYSTPLPITTTPNPNATPMPVIAPTPTVQPTQNISIEQRIQALEDRVSRLETENAELKTKISNLNTITISSVPQPPTTEKSYVRYAGSGNVFDRQGNKISYEFAAKNNIWNNIQDLPVK